MADRNKYYYLKLKENFFETEEMKILESMDNGYIYSNILMKMYLLSLKNEGKLIFKDTIPYNLSMLSTVLNHDKDNVKSAIDVFRQLNLIEVLESGAIYMLDIQNFIGKSSDEADRKRAYRQTINVEKKVLLDKCPTNVRTDCSNIRDRDRNRDKSIYMCENELKNEPNEPNEPNKNTNKKNIECKFDDFWTKYPKKLKKAEAKKIYLTKVKPSDRIQNQILMALDMFKDSEEWKKENGKYIPMPTSWLNQKRWEDFFDE